jgi:ABC-type branched-subunit amino acid transport system permease subunit
MRKHSSPTTCRAASLLAVLLVAILLGLAFAPFLFPGVKALSVAAKVLVFVVLVASFDLLLGYTGIVSFAHTMFFGIGAYGIAMATTRLGPTWEALAVGLAVRWCCRCCCRWRWGCFRCGCGPSSLP